MWQKQNWSQIYTFPLCLNNGSWNISNGKMSMYKKVHQP